MSEVISIQDRLAQVAARVRDAAAPEPELPTLEQISRDYVRAVLAVCQGNKSRAARMLGIDRRSLYRWLERGIAERDIKPENTTIAVAG